MLSQAQPQSQSPPLVASAAAVMTVAARNLFAFMTNLFVRNCLLLMHMHRNISCASCQNRLAGGPESARTAYPTSVCVSPAAADP
ncbi:hypothetical protein GCM10009626_13980 [Brachybacterium sacelli]